MTGSRISSADLDPRRRKILFRCWHRGTREMDLLLGGFADVELVHLGDGEMDDLEELMEAPDRDIFRWLTGEATTPAEFARPVFDRLRAFHRHDGPVHV